MTRASAHRAPSRRAAASATTVLRSALGALLVSRRRRSALLCARAFQLLGFFLAFFAPLRPFVRQPQCFFDLFQFFGSQPFGFILAGGPFVDVSVSHRFHQLIAHGDQLVAGLAQHFFFHLFELGHVHIFFKAWNFALFFFDLFFFNHPASLRAAILRSVTCGKP